MIRLLLPINHRPRLRPAHAKNPALTLFSGASATFSSANAAVSFRLSGDAAAGSDGSSIISASLSGEIVF